jgi:hypothetical protein
MGVYHQPCFSLVFYARVSKLPQLPMVYVGTAARPQLFPLRASVGRGVKRRAARQSAEEQAYSQECCDVQAWELGLDAL